VGFEEPVLVSGTDGCGTKVKMAILMDKHDTIGIDAVAMCVNDIICCGARPLFFLDYIACGKNIPEKIAAIVGGVAEGCVQSGAALIGGETAEHPGMMPVDEYDLAGFAVGIVDKKKILDNNKTAEGDVVIALASSGIHSNGFSLCRKVFDIDNNPEELYAPCEEIGGASVAETLLTPTRIYVKSVLALLEKVNVKGISHITGGGFYENIPRALPKGYTARIKRDAVKVLPIFDLIAKRGNIPERDMFNTYNMGVGMSITVPASEVDTALEILRACGEDAYVIGEIVRGDEGVVFC
jgi:phosphoribosylformylglycinamidine cyclo-ligase